MNPAWYIRRLAAMSADEVAFRIGFTFTKKRWRRRSRRGGLFASLSAPSSGPRASQPVTVSLPAGPAEEEAAALIEEANAALRHEWRFFGVSDIAEEKIDWHLDPLSGRRAPLIFSYEIDHRDAQAAGDPKIIWEKNRHHHLTVLAAAYTLTKKEAYAREVMNQILDWIAKNPCLMGINWGHPLELGIRLISWVWIERLLRSSAHYDALFGSTSPVWPCIGLHQEVISRTYSRGSSANNHLIGEMAGLFIASVVFPYFRSSNHFTKLSMKILEREAVLQTFQSGINRELAFGYHLFVAEFLLLALFEGEKVGISFSAEFRSLLAKTVEAVPLLTDAGGNLPRFGDGDDGMALQLRPHDSPRTDWLFQLASALLGIRNAAGSEPTLPIILMDAAPMPHDDRQLPPCVAFQDAGLYVMSVNRGSASEIFVMADAGPLGYGSMAAHGHADALSFTLSAGGKSILVDPGTYSYYTDRTTRDYFRGSRGHNTLTVDERDQSKASGLFLWAAHAETRVSQWREKPEGGAELTGYHSGYAASLGIIHCRTIALADRILTVRDMLSGTGDHFVRLGFHFAPECEIGNEMNRRLLVRNGAIKVVMAVDDRLETSLHRADHAGGWYSPGFGMKVPAYTLFASARFILPVTLTTTIEVLDER